MDVVLGIWGSCRAWIHAETIRSAALLFDDGCSSFTKKDLIRTRLDVFYQISPNWEKDHFSSSQGRLDCCCIIVQPIANCATVQFNVNLRCCHALASSLSFRAAFRPALRESCGGLIVPLRFGNHLLSIRIPLFLLPNGYTRRKPSNPPWSGILRIPYSLSKGDTMDPGIYLAHVGQRGGGLACRGTRQKRLQFELDGFGVPLIGDIAAPPTINTLRRIVTPRGENSIQP
jgi:hypothetical protein